MKRRNLQIVIQIHPGTWYLVPFNPVMPMPGVQAFTWLCFTIKASW